MRRSSKAERDRLFAEYDRRRSEAVARGEYPADGDLDRWLWERKTPEQVAEFEKFWKSEREPLVDWRVLSFQYGSFHSTYESVKENCLRDWLFEQHCDRDYS